MSLDDVLSAAETPVPADAPQASMDEPGQDRSCPVVGIGASAGGLEAFRQLLSHLPAQTGMAFVLIQHLDPIHESQLTALLAKATRLPVTEVIEGMTVEADHVYVIPPNASMTIVRGILRLTPRDQAQSPHLPVDLFFRSLAKACESRAIGVILSGTGSDGSLGLAEIKTAGGITFAQDEDSAGYSSMPQSAIASGCVDFVLPPDQIARELAQIGQHPYLRPTPTPQGEAETDTEPEGDFEKILARLRAATGVDFSGYRDTTIKRRIARRMALHKQQSLAGYMRLLQSNPPEIEALYRDMLINVTSFFRDPEVFEALKTTIFPEILKHKSPEDPVRIWVPGCSTGQEAYSLAMVLLEFLDQKAMSPAIQIFGTDINDAAAIEKARPGIYPPSIEAEVSPGRLRRFFTKVEGGYRISKAIRDLCVFARQDVTNDPPFSRLDLISCRNLLIYLSPPLQSRIILTFHYALNAGGFLLLGPSETVGKFSDLFEPVDRKHNLYSRTATLAQPYPYLVGGGCSPKPPARGAVPAERAPALTDMRREADRVILGRFAPAAVLIDENLEILQFRGQTAPYLQPPAGQPTHNILKMACDSLFVDLRGVIDEARKQNVTARRESVRMPDEHKVRLVNLEVTPLRLHGVLHRCFLVLFMEAEAPAATAGAPAAPASTGVIPADVRENAHLQEENAQLRQELASVKEYLQAIIEQQNAANEELQSANEEIRSANEELQSTNEEMQTAKEELQSTNEELRTVNDELQDRNEESTRLSDDLSNTLSSIELPMVMLGLDLRIRRFTAAAGTLLDLIPTDLGCPFDNIKSIFDIPNLEAMLLDVIATVAAREQEVQDRTGRWHSLALHPYRMDDNRIDGVVLVLRDLTDRKQAEEALRKSEIRYRTLFNEIDEGFCVIEVLFDEGDKPIDYRFLEINPAFEKQTGLINAQGKTMRELVPEHEEHWFETYGQIALTGQPARFQNRAEKLGRSYDVYAFRFRKPEDRQVAVLFRDITNAKRAEEELKAAKRHAEEASRAKDHFLAVLSHELRTPLTPVLATVAVLRQDKRFDADTRELLEVIQRNAELEARLIDDLLDVTRITQGKVELQKRPVDLSVIIRRAVEVCTSDIEARKLEFGVDAKDGPFIVEADTVRLQQVFWNLLRNAVKFTPVGGCVGIRCCRDGDGHVGVEVSDSGVGIEPEALSQLFTAFEQGGRGITRQFGGLGLGLTISKAMAEMHGGTISAHSAGSNKGATFRVRLPLMPAGTVLSPAAPQSRQGMRHPARSLRILLVEDHGDTARIMRRLLKADGHQVESAADVATALKLAGEQAFDLLLSDLGLPDGSGLDLMRALRGAGSALPGIALSGYGQERDIAASRCAGFAAHLTKPVDLPQLGSTIAKVLGDPL